MGGIEKELSSVLAAAFAEELDHDPGLSVEDDARAQRATADELVREALRGGNVGDIKTMDLRSFSTGSTAMLVAQVDTTLTFVVKVDRSPDLITEAHLLRRAAADPRLPPSIRRAFPRIYAIDDEGPIYGYLMESLEGFETLRASLFGHDPNLAIKLVTDLWADVLEPAYRATRSSRVVPNIVEDYFERAGQRLESAALAGLLPGGDDELRFEVGGWSRAFENGWGPVVEDASAALARVAPPFSTFVHGDPNPENVLWCLNADGSFAFRLIDPKNWWIGDYLFDVAKIGHYLRVTAPVEHLGLPCSCEAAKGSLIVTYEADQLHSHAEVEQALLGGVAAFAEGVDRPDSGWRDRYRLALAANLLGIVGPRLAKAAAEGTAPDRNLAFIALGEGLRLLETVEDDLQA